MVASGGQHLSKFTSRFFPQTPERQLNAALDFVHRRNSEDALNKFDEVLANEESSDAVRVRSHLGKVAALKQKLEKTEIVERFAAEHQPQSLDAIKKSETDIQVQLSQEMEKARDAGNKSQIPSCIEAVEEVSKAVGWKDAIKVSRGCKD
jgi:hypothetical protein